MIYLFSFLWLFFLFSAFNSANNLFYLVFALFSAFLTAPYLIASRAGAGLKIVLKPHSMIFAGSFCDIACEIINSSAGEKFLLELNASPDKYYALKPARIDYIEAHSVKKILLGFDFKKRGLVIPSPLLIKSNIPLLLKEKTIEISHCSHFIVFAPIIRLKFKTEISAKSRNLKKRIFNSDYGEINRFKNYDTGDSPAKINWRYYSVSKNLIVPRPDERAAVKYSIMLLLSDPGSFSDESYELAVSCASSLAAAFHEKRLPFNLITISDKIKTMESASEPLEKILSHLALIEGGGTLSRARLLRAAGKASASSGVFIVCAREFDMLPYFAKIIGAKAQKIIITGGAAEMLRQNVRLAEPDVKRFKKSDIKLEISSLEELGSTAL